MLVEIHMLQNHAPSNLNRDDTGSPKDCLFGDVRRARISSQCLKRSIRKSQVLADEMKDITMGWRTRKLPELVRKTLIEKKVSPDLAMASALKVAQFGKKKVKKTSKAGGKKVAEDAEEPEEAGETEEEVESVPSESKDIQTAQIMFLTPSEVDAVIETIYSAIQGKTASEIGNLSQDDLQREIDKKKKASITPDIALFGRMITSDAFINVQASIQVAHAISTNKIEHDFDYFTAVDDLKKLSGSSDDLGAGMIGDVEFNSACYYKYFSLDTDNFISNIVGDKNSKEQDEQAKQLLKKTIRAFLMAAIHTTPTGKQNTFAAHQLPDAILVEVRARKTPVSYANAFIDPARPQVGKDLVTVSVEKLLEHVELLRKKFGLEAKSRLWFTTRNIKLPNSDYCETTKDLFTKLEAAI
ncbi:MAG: hypothetical protein RBG13Loki_3433 [Promethearchaeota archaeon CR_4]|nr:MAG: hypothetical protein RBG13Loki_3433 [Candidatus Lokiarchaeota archaeon CR_4]